MFRQRTSPALETAQRRLNGLKYLNPHLDLGNGISAKQFATLTDELDTKLTAYNATLTSLDHSRAEIEALEERLRKVSERVLITMASLYGKESDEYEIAGGVKRVSRKATAAATPTSANKLAPAVAFDAIDNASANTPGHDSQNGTKNGKDKALVN